MRCASTNRASPVVPFREAVRVGLAPDGGLYLPTAVPTLAPGFFVALRGRPFPDIALAVSRTLLRDVVPDDVLERIVREALTFDAPLRPLDAETHVLELFHGPTLAFKDIGARFMARLVAAFARDDDRTLTILVATSGDTGSAVAAGFRDVPGVRVYVLYPRGGVSAVQERMLTVANDTVTAIAVEGTFDDCQRLVKQAFADVELARELRLSSANSINLARLIPQTFAYVHALAQLPETRAPVIVAVPSGNFGHLTAGLLAQRMGLPVARFVAACNANVTVVEYLRTGTFTPRPSVATIANAMDVGNPSNFARMLALFDQDADAMRRAVWATSCSDADVRAAIREAYARSGYVLDPHGAVGYVGLRRYREEHRDGSIGIVFATAHPAKFPEVIREELGIAVEFPPQLREYQHAERRSVSLPNEYVALRRFLQSRAASA